jgi:hypothetical protein
VEDLGGTRARRKEKKEYGIRKKEDPWLVMAFNPAPVIR